MSLEISVKLIINVLPQITTSAAAPLEEIDKIIM